MNELTKSSVPCTSKVCSGHGQDGECYAAENCQHPYMTAYGIKEIKFIKTRDVQTPEYGSQFAAALDFFIPNDTAWESFTIKPGVTLTVPSGIKLEIPTMYCFIALDKSSWGQRGLSVVAPLIDPDYRGEIHLIVRNTSNQDITVHRGHKLVQFILQPRIYVHLTPLQNESDFSTTERNQSGFGSTGLYSK